MVKEAIPPRVEPRGGSRSHPRGGWRCRLWILLNAQGGGVGVRCTPVGYATLNWKRRHSSAQTPSGAKEKKGRSKGCQVRRAGRGEKGTQDKSGGWGLIC